MMTDFPYEGLIYSLQSWLTPTKLKHGEYDQNVDTKSLADRMHKEWIHVAIQWDGRYFHRFRKIKSTPYLYYYKGNHDLLHKPLLAIVWPRKMTSYARDVLEELFRELQQYDVVTISGMAEGVDQLCHELSIQHQIPTIAVLGAGIAHLSKSRRRSVMDGITDAWGLIISEFPLKFKATNYSYPQRNRLVAGLSYGVFLPEAREWSGSLITVDFAHRMDIPVGGAPHSFHHEASQWLLIEMQAGRVRPVVDVAWWLEELFSDYRHQETAVERATVSLSDIQEQIYDYIATEGEQTIDGLAAGLSMDTSTLLSELTMMEMDGLIKQGEWGVYRV